jgi:hypothetical protein
VKILVSGFSLLGQLAAPVEQRVRYVYRRQRPTPLPRRAAKSGHEAQPCHPKLSTIEANQSMEPPGKSNHRPFLVFGTPFASP